MQFLIQAENLTEEEGKKFSSQFTSILEKEGFNVAHSSISDMTNVRKPMGDYSIKEETYFKSQITRRIPPNVGK